MKYQRQEIIKAGCACTCSSSVRNLYNALLFDGFMQIPTDTEICWRYYNYATVQMEDLSLSSQETVLENNMISFPVPAHHWTDACTESRFDGLYGKWLSIKDVSVARSSKFCKTLIGQPF